MITEIKVDSYTSFETIYIKADKESIGKIAAFVAELNNEQIKTKKDEINNN